ncbi:D-isomer specific 2-hydroxyacid dehydrogenase [Pilobolus umbonatus]|nr:D-isomer specific 2-hydroxyacid dehydrogenase [Pilobolus umbonatus]
MKLLVTRLLPPVTQQQLESQSVEIIQWKQETVMPRHQLLKQIKGVDGLLCLLTDKIDTELLDAAGPQLKVIATMSVGYDHIDVPAVLSRHIHLGYTPDVLTDATADLTLLLLLAAARRLKEGIHAAENGSWGDWKPTWLCGSQFTGKTVGIVGLGRIGQAVVRRIRAFGAENIIYTGRTRQSTDIAKYVTMDTLLQQSDFICICCALTSETQHLFDYAAFKKMKKSVVLVNSARGGIIQQDDLVRALKENLLGAVGLDVTTPEPLPPSHPLYTFPNCLILPHMGSATMETREKMATMALQNALAGLHNKPLLFPVKS